MSVLFPAPFGPIRPRRSPRISVKFRFRITVFSPKDFETFFSSATSFPLFFSRVD